MTGKGNKKEHDHFYFEFHEGGGRQALRQGDWKLVRLRVSQGNDKIKTELYNLAADPAEVHDLAAQYPDKVQELLTILNAEHVYDPNWPLLKEEYEKVKKQ